MILSATMYAEILRSLRSDAMKSQERRHHPRVGMRARVTIIPLDMHGRPQPRQAVWVRDVSLDGIGLTTTALPKGCLFVVEFCRDDQSLSLLCQVVRAHPPDPAIGARIVRQLTVMEKQSLNQGAALELEPSDGS